MLEEATGVFYDVDYVTLRAENDPTWADIAPESFQDPAIVFPPNQSRRLRQETVATGFLVSITRREGEEIWARSFGQVMVKPFPPNVMSWEKLREMKGPVLSTEVRAGLMGRLWNRRPGASQANASSFVTSRAILDNMPRNWHEDGAALNYELDDIFAASKLLPASQKWCLDEGSYHG
jgi:hypothetical protein